MKIACLLFIAFFICSSHGLKCYDYKLNNPRFTSSEPAVSVCNSYPGGYGDYSVYCATITFKNGDDPFVDCGDAEFCTERGCIDSSFCKQLGTPHDNKHPGRINDVNVTMTCCDEDLCNIEALQKDFVSSAKTFNNTHLLFFIIIFVVFNFISW